MRAVGGPTPIVKEGASLTATFVSAEAQTVKRSVAATTVLILR